MLLAAAPLIFVGCGGNPISMSNGVPHSVPPPPPLSFNKDIRPILSENCFFCHGPDPVHRGEDLRLDLFEAATEVRDGMAAIVPGDRGKSEVWKRIINTDDPMPPVKSHKSLTPEQIELLGRWIDEGANYEPHWAYVKPSRPQSPEVSLPEWKENPIDRFILAKLEKHNLRPSPPADQRTLLRRVTFDLTGLPPTPEQSAAFLADESPDAYERYVESLLADPAYGEHLAVWWLDLVRYGDTTGMHSDNPISVWPYRDWVIRSLNENLPFDQFTIMQLAGDLMQPEPTRDMLVASAYNRLALHTEEGGAQPKEYETIYRADRVANYSDVWLASTVSCAQCHDHKYDPITAKDFYAMAAFFADLDGAVISTERRFAGLKSPILFLPETKEHAAEVEKNEAAYQAIHEKHPDAYLVEEYFGSRDPLPPLPGGKMPEYGEEFKKILDQRTELAKKIPYVLISRPRGEPRTVRLLPRGNWQDESGEVVAPALPEFLGGPKSTDAKRLTRLDLARWTVSEENPLMARAIVNRLWGRYFGKAISSNPIELGSQGVPPSHPELLDWLAIEFREKNWDLKHMIRLIVTSNTYRQSADHRADLAEIDPFNEVFFARQSSFRLPAEAVRDQALAVSALLDRRIGGKSVFPYQPDGHWEPLNFPPRKYPTSKGPDLYRRGLYTWIQRTFPHPMLVTFDGPSRETCTGQRMVSTTPLQALATLNGPEFVEAARVLAARLLREEPSESARFEKLFLLLLARAPNDQEIATLGSLLQNQRARYKAAPMEAEKLVGAGQAPLANDLDAIEVASWTAVCRAMLNLHETLTRN